ncbi:DUF4854 domain-containing protein [Catenibacillus scindens]|uniref:DUF4854 domain-containing protein n=1 Tax=Catenibacillus scindens TaxID=673271 RepID=UPI00320B9121
MKTMMRRTMALVCSFALTFALTACGGSNNSSTAAADTQPAAESVVETETVAQTDVQTEVQTEAQTEASVAEADTSQVSDTQGSADTTSFALYSSLDEFVNSSEMQDQIATQQESLAGSGMSVDITADGDRLVYTFTLDDTVAASVTPESLEEGMEAQASTFESIASTLKLAVDVENPVVVVEYVDSQGNVIYSGEFSATDQQ